MSAPARKAVFNPGQSRTRSLIAKVHVGKKELGLDDDTYRQILLNATGRMSAADCTAEQLEKVIRHFEARGFKPKPRKIAQAGGRRPADHPSARKARAMWISLYHLGAVHNVAEKALESFAQKQLKVPALQWADQSQCYKLIEALKAMAERHGWSQDQAGTLARMNSSDRVRALKIRLCEAIVAKLKAKGLAGADWTMVETAFRLCGLDYGATGVFAMTVEDLETCARSLGDKLRDSGL